MVDNLHLFEDERILEVENSTVSNADDSRNITEYSLDDYKFIQKFILVCSFSRYLEKDSEYSGGI